MIEALGSGLAGACALTAAHLAVQKTVKDAPRMDVLGERAIAKTIAAAGGTPPSAEALYPAALAGDIVANSAYYSLVGVAGREAAPVTGAVLGLLAGVGALALPGPLGLGSEPSNKTVKTQVLTVGLYLLGGLVAGMVYRSVAPAKR